MQRFFKIFQSFQFNLIQGPRIMTSGIPSILHKKSEASIQEICLSAPLLTISRFPPPTEHAEGAHSSVVS
jgi:hypothetical protein